MSKNRTVAAGALNTASLASYSQSNFFTSGVGPFTLGSLVLGTIGVFVHESAVDPLTATWFRCAFGLLGLSAWIVLRRQLHLLQVPRTVFVWVIASGVLMVLVWGLFFAAIERTSAGVATMLFHTQPLWVLTLGWLFLNERIAKHRLLAVSAAMVGLLFATGVLDHTDQSSISQGDYWLGVAFCLVGAFCTGCVSIIARYLRAISAGSLAWWQCLIGTIALLAWPSTQGWPALGFSWLWLTGLGLLHTALAYSLLYTGMAKLTTDRIAVLQFVYPAVVLLVDWQVYEHNLSTMQLAGIGLMAVAIWFAEKPRKSKG
jgi:drug/metabolite transporter (DMT)-like permease